MVRLSKRKGGSLQQGIARESLTARQFERLKETFRKELRADRPPDSARDEIRIWIEDMLEVETDSAVRIAADIERTVLAEVADVRQIDVPVIDERGQTRWYAGPQATDVFWPTLQRHLLDEKDWTAESVKSIDDQSSSIVARLAPPEKPDKFSARGLVVGYVQSGKTANMTAVIAKAMDSGYKLVIILAGLTDALREQTQERMEEDLVSSHPELWDHLTTKEEDFDAGTRQHLVIPKKGGILAVMKKNTHVLARLRDFLEQTAVATRMKLPALVIDDETDQASPDVARQDRHEDPSTINRRIREVLKRLPKCSYLGYTATPFANVLINPGAEGNEEYDRDLYPRDFIVSIPAPDEYFGAERLFGRDLLSADDPGPSGSGLDVIRTIPEAELETIAALAKGEAAAEGGFPASLEKALLWFVLATAARQHREPSHSTMLLHTSRLTEAHENLEFAVNAFRERFASLSEVERRERLQTLWREEYPRLPPTDFEREPLPEDSVLERSKDVLAGLLVVQDNYVNDSRLEFPKKGDPVWAVIIGGDRLARGVTLPGLIVSYFGRNARQYDTLMQMGRWFGYRHGYEELPRIWMTAGTMSSFRELATIEAELREDIAVYRDGSIRPVDWGVRIRKVPGLLVTRRPAMQSSKEAALSYSGEHLQTIRFYHRDREWLERNWRAGASLLERAAEDPSTEQESRDEAFLVRNVPVDAVLEFLRSYQTCREQVRTNTKALRKYIEKYESGELARWNLAVMMPARSRPGSMRLGPLAETRLINRSALQRSPEECTDIKALMSRKDILVDTYSPAPSRSEWKALKDHRSNEYGGSPPPLLLLYPIDKDSQPRNPEAGTRDPLNAVHHVLGMGILFPEDPTGFKGHYITVDLGDVVIEDEEDIDGD